MLAQAYKSSIRLPNLLSENKTINLLYYKGLFLFTDFPEYMSTIFAVTSRVCAAGSYYACLQFASELFPTEIRGKGSSAFEISGGIGLFIQPQINYLVSTWLHIFCLRNLSIISQRCALSRFYHKTSYTVVRRCS